MIIQRTEASRGRAGDVFLDGFTRVVETMHGHLRRGLQVLNDQTMPRPRERGEVQEPAEVFSLVGRTKLGLWSLIAVSCVMLVADLTAGSSGAVNVTAPLALGLLRLAFLAGALVVVTTNADEMVVIAAALAATALHTACGIVLAHWRGQPETALVAAVTVAVGAAALIPWSALCQALLVAWLMVILAAGEFVLEGNYYSTILVVVGMASMAATVFLSWDLGVTRQLLAARALEDVESQRQADALKSALEATIRKRTASLEATREEFMGLCQAASHDLRPPLRAMAGFGEILREAAREEGRPEHVRHLHQIIEHAEGMGTRLDSLLQEVRTSHREITGCLESLSNVARSEQSTLARRNRSCRWTIEDGVVAGAASRELASLLRSLLRYFAPADEASLVRGIAFGNRSIAGLGTYFVRVSVHRADPESFRKFAAEILNDAATGPDVGAELAEAAAAARALETLQGGEVWFDGEDGNVLTIWFRGPVESAGEERR